MFLESLQPALQIEDPSGKLEVHGGHVSGWPMPGAGAPAAGAGAPAPAPAGRDMRCHCPAVLSKVTRFGAGFLQAKEVLKDREAQPP